MLLIIKNTNCRSSNYLYLNLGFGSKYKNNYKEKDKTKEAINY